MPVVLLCHCDGTNGSSAPIVDSSASGHTITQSVSNAITHTTAQFKFGASSLNFPVGSHNGLQSVDHADWDFGAGPFTVEAWVRTAGAVVGYYTIVAQGNTGSGSWWFGHDGNTLYFGYSTTGTGLTYITGSHAIPITTWVHLAADRDASNVLRIYANGVVIGSGSAAATIFNSAVPLSIGATDLGSSYWGGQLDEIRITKGTAQYGGAFTPPTGPFGGAAAATQDTRVMVLA